MSVKLLTEHHLECLSLEGGCRGSSESTHVKMSNYWKSHALAHYVITVLPVCLAHSSNMLQSWPRSQFWPAACFHAILNVFSFLFIQAICLHSPSSNSVWSQGRILCLSKGRIGFLCTVLRPFLQLSRRLLGPFGRPAFPIFSL